MTQLETLIERSQSLQPLLANVLHRGSDSADVLVKEPARGGEQHIRKVSDHPLGKGSAACRGHSPMPGGITSSVDQSRLDGAEVAFESDQSLVVQAAQVEFLKAVLLRVFNGLPEQKRHAPKIVKVRIGAAVLVNQRGAVTQSHNAGDCVLALESGVNRDAVAER